jgi:RNA polymerase sigma-70 factor (ECF subfamily)
LLNLNIFSDVSRKLPVLPDDPGPELPKSIVSEEWLVAQARSGDEAAFVELVELYWGVIHVYLLRLVGEAETAADLTQETFYRAYKSLQRLPEGRSLQFKPWLYKIATNRAFTYSQARKRRRWLSLDFLKGQPEDSAVTPAWQLDTSPGPVDYSLAAEASRQVVAALYCLPKDQAAVLLLRFYHDLSIEEIGQVLGLNSNAVRARLHRARLAFRRSFKAGQDREEG